LFSFLSAAIFAFRISCVKTKPPIIGAACAFGAKIYKIVDRVFAVSNLLIRDKNFFHFLHFCFQLSALLVDFSDVTGGKERSQTMKKTLILVCLIVLGFLLALFAYNDSTKLSAELESAKAELEPIKADFEKTANERDALKAQAAELQRDREQLQQKVNELTGSREQLQKQVEKLTFSNDQSRQQLAEIVDTRDKLKQQVAELTGSRDKLQQQNDELAASNDQLNKEVKELTVLRDEALGEAETARKRIEVLVAMMDSLKQEPDRQQQDDKAVTSQAQEGTEPPMIEIGEIPQAATDVNQPAGPNEPGERPTCHSFNTARPRIMPGQAAILSWQVANADRIRIEPDVGTVSALGSVVVRPSKATTYTLIATNEAGESRMTCRIEVGEKDAVEEK
jgi:peptidoglycan hydrolase CwlO-like protein